MKIQLIRHATLLIEIGGRRLLIDPMFSPKGSFDPTPSMLPQLRNPTVDLPMTLEQLPPIDAVIVTHRHPDHFDQAAAEWLPKDITLLCQSEDADAFRKEGFAAVMPLELQSAAALLDLRITRTGGRHGRGAIGQKMGTVSGFVLESQQETLYIAGDTVWCEEVGAALDAFRPNAAVLFAGEARFPAGGPITMGINDMMAVLERAPETKVVVAHLEAWNHCGLTRAALREDMRIEGMADRVAVPEDGEWVAL
ncbi:MBL fold metallo-hydrolase [Paenibacillus nanensis]|uniref:MBL fold metallo-hydrolase n=1 Tax=Paenibacillus nanensis TaxID=393251 RepID=A0A3A1USP3_9BACL|nr:MBL fold metallo-hydrolase [Paenibacillus nanensis]RIX51507.1 MBL fold metallo-hydrolase [Paenibacillus nanensis]